MPYGDNWNLKEIFAVIKLALFMRDNDCNKTAELNRLTIKLKRVPPKHADYVNDALASGSHIGAKPKICGSVERKVWNVSAMLIDAGLPGISGFNYSGGNHYQFIDVDCLAVALKIDPVKFLRRINKGRRAHGLPVISVAHIDAAHNEQEAARKQKRVPARSTNLKSEV